MMIIVIICLRIGLPRHGEVPAIPPALSEKMSKAPPSEESVQSLSSNMKRAKLRDE